MSRAVTARRTLIGTLAAGAAAAVIAMPLAGAQPVEPTPAPPAPTQGADCTAAGLSETLSSVTASLNEYFDEHPDVNQALIDITRQPPFVASGQFDGYFRDHPDQANDLRGLQAPLNEFKNRCGMQVTPAEALTVLSGL